LQLNGRTVILQNAYLRFASKTFSNMLPPLTKN